MTTVPMETDDVIKATVDKRATDDIRTVFFLNFLLNFAENDRVLADQVETKDLIQIWQAWNSSLCEGKVQDQINNDKLPADDSAAAMSKRSTYHAKVFDYLLRQASWSLIFLQLTSMILANINAGS